MEAETANSVRQLADTLPAMFGRKPCLVTTAATQSMADNQRRDTDDQRLANTTPSRTSRLTDKAQAEVNYLLESND